MPMSRKPAMSAFTAALLAAIYTAWAPDLGFQISKAWVLIAVASAATATAYAITWVVGALRRLTDRSPRPVARQ